VVDVDRAAPSLKVRSLLLGAAAAHIAQKDGGASMQDKDRELKAVLEVAKREPAAMSAGDVESHLSLLADSAIYMPPGGPAKEGQELRDWLADFDRSSSIEWLSYDHGETRVSGDLAFHDYAYAWRVTSKVDGKSVTGRGKGIQILARSSDGAWKLIRNIWNADPPA
jgi:ketosteroid isomerase-like protein